MSPATGNPTSRFVVRRRDSWVLTPPEGRVPVSCDLGDVVALLAATTDPCPFWRQDGPVAETPTPSIPLDQHVEALPAFLGHVCHGRLHVEGQAGRRALLDHRDLGLLDRLGSRVLTARDLATMTPDLPVDEIARRLATLVGVGRLRLAAPPVDPASAEGRPAGRPRRSVLDVAKDLLRPTRDRLRDRRAGALAATLGPTDGAAGPSTKVPVYAPFQASVGPNLALGMLLAYARAHRDGALADTYELRPIESVDDMLADLADRSGPAVLLCSNYVWSLDHNLEVARRAKVACPELVVLHGGPSTPKYEQDAVDFAHQNADVVDVLVRGEGEVTFAAVLDALAVGGFSSDLTRLGDVAGLSYVAPDGSLVRTPDRDRVADLESLPSPYLTGEYDHLDPAVFTSCVAFESNRGCPYGCTFCDWGSATMARIRMFDLDRVKAELSWAAERGLDEWNVTDANFGIVSRDIEIAEHIADLRRAHATPEYFGFTVAKNTTKHLARIVEVLAKAGMSVQTSLSLQTRDEDTLEAVDRANIKTEHYVELAADFRRRNIPLQGDLMLGLPGQTPASYQADLQFMLDHEITARTWLTQLLPNAPMNEPAYRERFALRTSREGVVVESSSFSSDDRQRMMRIRFAHTVFEHFGLLRHVGRHLQWEHGVPMMDLAVMVMDRAEADPDRYPLLNWVARYFDLYAIPPLGWPAFYAEVRRFVTDELSVTGGTALDTVLAVQQFLMPEIDRVLPSTLALPHDYLAYYRDATAELYRSGRATGPSRPLQAYPAGTLEIHGDPAGLGVWRMRPFDDSRDEWYVRPFWVSSLFELDSPLARNLPETRLAGEWRFLDDREPELARLRTEVEAAPAPSRRIPVRSA